MIDDPTGHEQGWCAGIYGGCPWCRDELTDHEVDHEALTFAAMQEQRRRDHELGIEEEPATAIEDD